MDLFHYSANTKIPHNTKISPSAEYLKATIYSLRKLFEITFVNSFI